MEESENALPLDDSFWEHIEHIDFAIAIPVSNTRMLDIISALRDVYETICDNKLEEAKMCVTALAAILVASKYDKAEEVWEEFSVKEAMRNFDTSIKEILNEKP
jgi:CO dehydrogenase/acetyl-CoA synthase delta subunit